MNLRPVGLPAGLVDLKPSRLRVVDLDDPVGDPLGLDEVVLCHCGRPLGHQDGHR